MGTSFVGKVRDVRQIAEAQIGEGGGRHGGSSQKGGIMAAGYVNLRKQRKRQQRKVGREEEGSSSNRPELAAFVLALRSTPVTNPMLYLFDNQALLKAVKRWVGEGGKATLVGAPDADILLEAR